VKIPFFKYQGTGNDFVMLNNLSDSIPTLTSTDVSQLCDRHFGIGADGLIVLNPSKELDFEMAYYNSDGTQSFCGNGARCAVGFAKACGIDKEVFVFRAIDGIHHAEWFENGRVSIHMKDVSHVELLGEDFVLDTGSPHFVRFVNDVKAIDVCNEGASIRNSDLFKIEGINVNFVEVFGEKTLRIRTYERGVENETLSCGTGATACALAFAFTRGLDGNQCIQVAVEGGELEVVFDKNQDLFNRIELKGPYANVFQGTFELPISSS
jgi:diaminopimelate epimerase